LTEIFFSELKVLVAIKYQKFFQKARMKDNGGFCHLTKLRYVQFFLHPNLFSSIVLEISNYGAIKDF